jgi:hypothetical protein
MSTLDRIPNHAARRRAQEIIVLVALGAAFLLVLATTLGLVSA